MKKILTIIILVLIAGYTAFFPSIQGSQIPQEAFAHGGSNDECENGNDINPVNSNLATYTAPNGQIVTGVCIKAGNKPFGDGHSDILTNGTYDNGCFTVSGVGTQTVTVVRNFDSNTCQGISHIDVYVSSQPTNTPTITATPTITGTITPSGTITPTPTDYTTPTPTTFDCPDGQEYDSGLQICISCPGGGDCEVIIGSPTPTATISASPTPTATETPKDEPKNDLSSNDNPSSGSVGGASSSTQEVLGTSTFAPTGVFTQTISNAMLSIGALFTGIATILYAKKKKA